MIVVSDDDDKWIAVSYQVQETSGYISSAEFNQAISELVGGTKIDKKLKDRINAVDLAKEKMEGNTIEITTGMVGLFDSVTPKEMAEYQHQDNQISPIIGYVKKDQKPPNKFIYQIKSKLSLKLALQQDRLILKQGVLHQLYIFNEIKYHQFILPQCFHCKILIALHDHFKDAQNWVTGCCCCQVARGDYNQPKPKIGHLKANNLLDLVCLDFTKINLSKSGKENVLIITNAFSKFSLAVCTLNQMAKTVA